MNYTFAELGFVILYNDLLNNVQALKENDFNSIGIDVIINSVINGQSAKECLDKMERLTQDGMDLINE